MKKLIIIFLCFFIYPSLSFSGDQKVFKITDKESIMQFTEADEIWPDAKLDRAKFENNVRSYLKNKQDTNFLDYAGEDTKTSCDYILKNLSRYNIEYAGVIEGGKKLFYCIMLSGDMDYQQNQSFSVYIMDGGCSVIQVVYDPINEKILSLGCNGVA